MPSLNARRSWHSTEPKESQGEASSSRSLNRISSDIILGYLIHGRRRLLRVVKFMISVLLQAMIACRIIKMKASKD
jgi:hypothetical protein